MIWAEVSFRRLYDGSAAFSEMYDFMDQCGFRLLSLEEGFRGERKELLEADALFMRLGVPIKALTTTCPAGESK